MIDISLTGQKEAAIFLEAKKKLTKNEITKAMTKSAILIQGEVKESIAGRKAEPRSVDTGRFLNSVEFEASDDNAVIFSQIPYAKFLEWGTRYISPRKHFFNSAARNKANVMTIFKNKLKSI